MTWIKLDDQAVDHPKVANLSDRAFRWWVRGLSYASRFLTNGHLPAVFVRQVPKASMVELTGPNLWTPNGDGMDIHDYLVHQSSKESVTKKRVDTAQRVQRYRERKGNGVTNADVTAPENREQSPENRVQRTEDVKSQAPRPLTMRRNLNAEFEHPRFDVPTSWHLRTVKGLADGESRMRLFYRWLAERVERTNEDTLPRFEWLDACFKDWLASSSTQRSSVPSPAETSKMIADRIAMAGR